MDPFTFGLVFVGSTGGAIATLAILETADIQINWKLVNLILSAAACGSILWLFKVLSNLL